jgi:hypothetical protein
MGDRSFGTPLGVALTIGFLATVAIPAYMDCRSSQEREDEKRRTADRAVDAGPPHVGSVPPPR